MDDAAKVIEEALALSPQDRARVAHELIASLDQEEDVDAEDAWVSEVQARLAAIDRGEVEPVDWETVRARVRARLRSDP